MSDTQFTEGMRVYAPSPKAPEYIKANIQIAVTDFTAWLEQHARPDGTVRIVIKESKGGKYYASLDQFAGRQQDEPTVQMGVDDIPESELPF